jgi:iron(III) transport system permease protein
MQSHGLLGWLGDAWLNDPEAAPGLFQAPLHGRWWLAPIALPLAAPLLVIRQKRLSPQSGALLVAAGAVGLAWFLLQGFGIGLKGWQWPILEAAVGPLGERQFGVGWGALLVALSLLIILAQGLAARGLVKGDIFVVGSIAVVVASVALFIFYPVLTVLSSAVRDNAGALAPSLFFAKLFNERIWGLGCTYSAVRCGVAWNTLGLAILTGAGTTLLGLAFALVVARTGFTWKRTLRMLTVLPIITPPFVIGLAIILLFGRSGSITQFVAALVGVDAGRWIYGLTGIWLAQMLAFTPIAFLVLIGVVEGVSPSLEEAAQTLRADASTTFRTVSLPLMRPGLANAFLLGFIESMADFGNPLVLGGNFNVLSTEIFFAIVGAQYDQGRAAVLALVLLGFTLGAFWIQQRWLGRRSYTTVTGKGDSGVALSLPRPTAIACYAATMPWALLTLAIYALILFGGFVEIWGRDHTLTLRHFKDAFAIAQGEHGLVWSGAAWNSFFTTLEIAALSAVPTAAIGLLTAYLLVRQDFAGKRTFEFGTMLSFAIPGTVIGVSYILAFNVPPIEITGTGIILVIAFVFRNMPVGVRAGIAAMAQLDRSLDEASLTLRADTFQTVRRVVLPLLRPALIAALVYSFVRAMTAISAVVFLVSANYDMATSYILGRVENADYGLAIAYSSVLILVMLAAILVVQLAVGERRLGRRGETRPRTGAALGPLA